jgi:hypothetical protein
MAKNALLERIRVEDWRLEAFYTAHATAQKADPDLTFSGWIRSALDDQVERDLGYPPQPPDE